MTDSSGLFSVVIPVKNAVGTLGRTLEALHVQSYRKFEIIIVDGGSTDGTLELIAATGVQRLILLSDTEGGITTAVNKGIKASSGEFVLPWMCADDYLDPNFLEAMAGEFGTPDIGVVYGNWHVVDRGVVTKSRVPVRSWKDEIEYYMPVILPNAFAFRASVFRQIGYLDERLKYSNDYDFLRRVVIAGVPGAYSPSAWYYYQVGGLSQQRFLDCALEVAGAAVAHGSSRRAVYMHLARLYLATHVSFMLNRIRRLLHRR